MTGNVCIGLPLPEVSDFLLEFLNNGNDVRRLVQGLCTPRFQHCHRLIVFWQRILLAQLGCQVHDASPKLWRTVSLGCYSDLGTHGAVRRLQPRNNLRLLFVFGIFSL